MKSRKGMVWPAVLIVLALAVFFNRSRIHFDWAIFWMQLRHVSWVHIAAGTALIYATFWLRSARWSVFLSATKKVSPLCCWGRSSSGLRRSRSSGGSPTSSGQRWWRGGCSLSISSQVAVYTIERMFDLGAAALIFSGALLFCAARSAAPRGLRAHGGSFRWRERALIAVFAVVIRVAGGAVARVAGATIGWLSKPIGESVAQKIRGFREGLDAVSSAQDFVVVSLISLAMWGMIGCAVRRDAARLRRYAGAGDDFVLAHDAADGRQHRWLAAATARHRLVHADRRHCGCDA